MPSNIPATTIRIDPEVKREATAILDELGLSGLATPIWTIPGGTAPPP